MRSHRWLFVVLLLAVAPAAANVGPPWLFTGFFSVFILPLPLGLVEGLLLGFWIGRATWRAIRWMIEANISSAAFGILTIGLLDAVLGLLPGRSLYAHYLGVVWAVIALAYGLTVLIEWRGCRRAMGHTDQPYRDSLVPCLTINAATYAVVAWCVLNFTAMGLYRSARPVRDTGFAAGITAWVYYLRDGQVRRTRLDGADDQTVMPLPAAWREWSSFASGPQPKLSVLPSEDGQTHDLWISQHRDHQPPFSRLIEQLPGRGAGFDTRRAEEHGYWPERNGQRRYGHGFSSGFPRIAGSGAAADLRPRAQREWTFTTGFWPEEGLVAHLQGGSWRDSVRFAMGTPFLSAQSGCATVLPGDLVVWQLGAQIAVLDFRARRWSILVDGIGPAVVLDD